MALESVPNARVFLESGFTTVRDVGVYRALTDIALRDAIAKGYIVGPRMFVAGAYITISGGAGAMTGFAPDITLPWDLRYGEANSPWEVRQKIRLLAAAGADHIKILSSGAVLTHGSNPQSQEFTPEELAAAVDEANHFGLRVASHAHSPEGIKNAIRAGVASVEHASLIDDEGIALANSTAPISIWIFTTRNASKKKAKTARMTADFLRTRPRPRRKSAPEFHKALHAGVKLSFGTDAGVCPYDRSINQFAFMVKYGMTPMQAIQSATASAADLLGKSEILGSIAPGKYADIVAAPDNPLDDIHAIEHITFVMKEGKVYKQVPNESANTMGNARCHVRAQHCCAPNAQAYIARPIALRSFLIAPRNTIAHSRPSLFCATTNPLGVGNNTTEISPSASIFFAASRTVFTAELASCIKINPYGFICGKNLRTSCSRIATSLS